MDLRVGQLARREQRFCPYAAVNKYPYQHLRGDEMKEVSEKYFAFGAFRERGWDIYYIRPHLESSEKPLLLIPEPEVEQLFREIQETLGIQAAFPDVSEVPGFQLSFTEEGIPRPRYLGRFTGDNGMLELEDAIPAEGSQQEGVETLDERSFPFFKQKMLEAIEAGKKKSEAVRQKKRRDRVDTKKKWCSELKRAQCYLGLRPRGTANFQDFDRGPNMSHEESQNAREKYEIAAGIKLPQLDVNSKAPYDFDKNVIFVCVDIEVFEKDHSKITELGVCTLDTLDIGQTAPDQGGKEWMKHLRCRHFRVVETAHLNNTEFVSGCADRFEPHFGRSEWVSIKEVPQVLASCFKPPYSEPGKYTAYPANPSDVPRGGSNIQAALEKDPPYRRNVVLLGHDIRSDIGYLRNIGYDVGNLSNLIEAIDTANLYRAFKHEQNSTSLGGLLLELGLTGWNLHNAGNDAAYTAQALIGISIAALSPVNKPAAELSREELKEAADEVKDRMKEELEDWEVAEEEGGDGGDPIKMLPSAEMVSQQSFDKAMKLGQKADEKQAKKYAKRGSHLGQTARMTRAARQENEGQPKPRVQAKPTSMPFDEDAMDEAFGPPPAQSQSQEDPVMTSSHVSTTDEQSFHTAASSVDEHDDTFTSNETLANAESVETEPDGKENWVPPHLRPAKRQSPGDEG